MIVLSGLIFGWKSCSADVVVFICAEHLRHVSMAARIVNNVAMIAKKIPVLIKINFFATLGCVLATAWILFTTYGA